MHMVFYTVYDEVFAPGFIDQVANDGLQLTSPGLVEYRRSVFYGKYCLEIDLVVAVWHGWLCGVRAAG